MITSKEPVDPRFDAVRLWRERHRWPLKETIWLMRRADVDFNLNRAEAVVAEGFTREAATAAIEAAPNRVRGMSWR